MSVWTRGWEAQMNLRPGYYRALGQYVGVVPKVGGVGWGAAVVVRFGLVCWLCGSLLLKYVGVVPSLAGGWSSGGMWFACC